MTAFAVAALLLAQAPETAGPLLELDLDYETAYATRTGELAAERGETVAGVGAAWLNLDGWRLGLSARVATIANDPIGLAGGMAHPLVADVTALVAHRWWISRFGIGVHLGVGAESYAGARGAAGALFEAGLEGSFRFNETWSIHLKFAFAPTTGLEPVFGPHAYWRFVGGVEWSSPI